MTIVTMHPLHLQSSNGTLETYMKKESHGDDDDPDAVNHHPTLPMHVVLLTQFLLCTLFMHSSVDLSCSMFFHVHSVHSIVVF